MCGRVVRVNLDYATEFGVDDEDEMADRLHIPERWNIAPTQEDVFIRAEPKPDEVLEPDQRGVIVRTSAVGSRHFVPSYWGLVPRWAKDRSGASKMINARAESLMERSSFRNLVGGHRCVIPVSGFYEWTPGSGKQKDPFHFHRADGRPLALAGLWTVWRDQQHREEVTTHTIITCAANETMAPYHHRMPVILAEDALDLWLDPTLTDPGAVLPVLVPAPDDLLVADRVSRLVNDTRNDSPQLLLPFEE